MLMKDEKTAYFQIIHTKFFSQILMELGAKRVRY
jgi:hypothetical protein